MIIEANSVGFTYHKAKRPALSNLDFHVNDGEIFGFLGPSGAGKSTTLGILTGTLAGWRGRIEVGGRDPSRANGDFYRDIGVCFESPRFHDKFSATENLRLFGALYGTPLRDMNSLMARMGLGEHMDKKVEAYSKGMKTRLSLARSLLHNPNLLFLDEPTNGLDPTLSRTICDLILEEREKGKTIFLTTHDMATATTLCDRVGFLSEGNLVLVDTPANLALQFGKKEVRVEYKSEGTSIARGSESKIRQTVSFPMVGLADNADFLALLRSGNVETLHSEEAGLDDIFRRVTGRHLAC